MDNLSLDLFNDKQDAKEHTLERAEKRLLALADKAYTATALKPMSKVLFLVSRSFVALDRNPRARSKNDLINAYQTQCQLMGAAAPFDDYSYPKVLDDAGVMLDSIVADLSAIRDAAGTKDRLGLAFDTLLRGRWESGEGLGTFLTPEEVVAAIVDMMLEGLSNYPDTPRIADICAGTGRFVRSLVFHLRNRGINNYHASLYDQSSMSMSLGLLNMFFDNINVDANVVQDSLADGTLSNQVGQFDFLATNPPFGLNKYTVSKNLWKHLSQKALHALGIQSVGDACEPATLFLLRNLSLLAPNGVLGIVLPDGVLQSRTTIESIIQIEKESMSRYDLRALVSLPAHTFYLGGTVAKTSFVIFQRSLMSDIPPVCVGEAKHVGFVKKGNRRAVDPAGNDLLNIVKCFKHRISSNSAVWTQTDWRSKSKISSGALLQKHLIKNISSNLQVRDKADLFRENMKIPAAATHAHISVLFVDSLGTIDLAKALNYRPTTAGFNCLPGDVILSCINPRKWRVALIPNLKGITWSCSMEFAVLRSKNLDMATNLFYQLMRREIAHYVSKLVNGTSSSRQRVQKEQILNIPIEETPADKLIYFDDIIEKRLMYYNQRIREIEFFERIGDQ